MTSSEPCERVPTHYVGRNPKIRENVWQSGMGRLTTIHLSLIFGFFKCVPFRPTALKLGCVTNFDMLIFVMDSFLWLMKFNLCELAAAM